MTINRIQESVRSKITRTHSLNDVQSILPFYASQCRDSFAPLGMTRCPARNDVPCHSEEVEDPPLSFRGGRKPSSVNPRRSQTDEGIFPAFRQPACPPLCHLGYLPQMQQIPPPGLRPQMRKNGPGVHSARRRGNDSAHFGRFTGRVCTRTALRGTFSAFAA